MAAKKMKKIVMGLGLLGVVLVIGVGSVFFFGSGAIIKTATERVMSYVLEVPVTLDDAHLDPLNGDVTLTGMTIHNPEGFNTASAIAFSEAKVSVDIKSFTTDEPLIRLLSIIDPKITLEQGLRKSNLSELVKSASRFDTGGGEPEPEPDEPDEAGKKVQVEKILVQGATVALSAPLLKGKEVSYTLPTIEMSDLGGEGQHVSIAEALKIFLERILTESVKASQDVVSAEVLADLKGTADEALGRARDLIGDNTDQAVERLGEAAENLGIDSDTIKDAAEKVGLEDAAEKAKEGFGNLLRRAKKDD